jgi:hypothetical protein
MHTDQRSILDHLMDDRPFGLTSQITIQDEPVICIGLDNGNDAAKLALLSNEGKFVSVRIPTAYQPARTFQGGSGEVTYHLDGLSDFWIGEAAIRNDGRALPIGPTAQRLPDPRQHSFIGACMIEALIVAGYEPGAYLLAVGFAIPNSEIVIETKAVGDKLGVSEDTKAALKKYIRGQVWQIDRTDERGKVTSWTLTVRHIIPQAQSIGTFIAWGKAPSGATVTDYDALTILDIGGGDLQRTDVYLKPYRMISERIGDGTIDIARALKGKLPKAKLNDVTAQHSLVTRQTMEMGRNRKINKEVDEVLHTNGQDLVGQVLPVLQDSRRYVIITGGGAVLLRDMLLDRLATVGKTQGEDFLLVNHGLAAALNSVGALFAVLFMAAKKG